MCLCASVRQCAFVCLRAKLCLCIWVCVYCACWRAGSCANECVCLWLRYTFVYSANKQKHNIRVCTNMWRNYINSQKHHFQLAMHLSCIGAHKYIYNVNNTAPSQKDLLQLDIPVHTAAALRFDLASFRLENQAAHLHSNASQTHHTTAAQATKHQKARHGNCKKIEIWLKSNIVSIHSHVIGSTSVPLKCCSCAAHMPMHNLL